MDIDYIKYNNILVGIDMKFNENKESKNLDFVSERTLHMMLKYGKASDTIGIYKSKPLIELPYGLVKKELPYYQKQGNIESMVNLIMKSQFPYFDISKINGNELIYFIIWINEQQEKILKIEKQYLSSQPEPEMVAAGINRLNEFDVEPLLERIAKDWNCRPEDVEKYPYYRIYRKLKMDKIEYEINKNYQKIMEEKAKHKR